MPLNFPLDNQEKGSLENTQFRVLNILKLHAGLPVFTATPTYTGFEGEFIWVNDGTYYSLYAYINGGWRKLGTTDLTLDIDAIPDSDGSAEGMKTNDINAGQSIAFPNLVYLKSDGEWWKVDADAVATCQGLLGIALETKTNGNPCNVLLHGFVRNDVWSLTVGQIVYAGTEVGALSFGVAPSGTDDVVKIVGVVTHTDRFYFRPEMTTVVHS